MQSSLISYILIINLIISKPVKINDIMNNINFTLMQVLARCNIQEWKLQRTYEKESKEWLQETKLELTNSIYCKLEIYYFLKSGLLFMVGVPLRHIPSCKNTVTSPLININWILSGGHVCNYTLFLLAPITH